MGKPAARVTDMHTCPLVSGVVPHVGGPILPPCCPTVLIGGLPAARVTDLALCAGPVDAIVQGSPTVLIGGLMAARIGDLTSHGGIIVTGQPNVLIGDLGSGGAAAAEPGSGPTNQAIAKSNPTGGSTVVTVDKATKTISIKTNMEFMGPGATEAYAQAAKKQIEETWSGKMRHDGAEYNVNVAITTKVSPTGNPTPGYDTIHVDPANTRMSQHYYGARPGYQTPAAATDTARPRRIAHEYGHTLGLRDGYHDSPQGAVKNDPTKLNDIMSETWPDQHGTLPHPHQDHYETILKNYGF
ncbi:PAAR domain-containing protein [Bosea sp. (in: a-proteobacteria)]|uniref:PAAR domain-containing protein n=1 Tax=Bosea sp. (in: a-proteobacteria) TaxID=1871050 RepID=UPI003415F760|nr:PAAR domain-containing protein [Bosea sp. (in: a-proteobacteria)]